MNEDLISRQAAIDAMKQITNKYSGNYADDVIANAVIALECLPSADIRDQSVDIGYLYEWYQDSVDPGDEPVWTNKHVDEVFHDFYLIPKQATDGNGGD